MWPMISGLIKAVIMNLKWVYWGRKKSLLWPRMVWLIEMVSVCYMLPCIRMACGHHEVVGLCFRLFCCVMYISGIPRGWFWEGCSNPPPPKFRSFDEAEPNSQFRGKYIGNNLTRIRVSLIFLVVSWKGLPASYHPPQWYFFLSKAKPYCKAGNTLSSRHVSSRNVRWRK
jgi:hypothetical protein